LLAETRRGARTTRSAAATAACHPGAADRAAAAGRGAAALHCEHHFDILCRELGIESVDLPIEESRMGAAPPAFTPGSFLARLEDGERAALLELGSEHAFPSGAILSTCCSRDA
jgi:polysaccharide pyruvyl transferase WcaK-like protein